MTDPTDNARVYACEECDWTGTIADMDAIVDVHQRVLPGEFMAAGCCPECCSLVGVSDDDVPTYTLQSAEGILAKRGIGCGAELAAAMSMLLVDQPPPDARARAQAALSAFKSLAAERA